MQSQFTRNPYRIDGERACIALLDRQRIIRHEAIIDLADLEQVIAFGRWHAHPVSEMLRPYVSARPGGRGRQVYLHRLLLDPPADMVVDHINRNPLDCRRSNLRVCTNSENSGRKSMHVRYIAGERRHTLEEAVRLYRQLHDLADTALDEELAQLRKAG